MFSYNPKQPGSRPFEKPVTFQVRLSNVRVEDITTRHLGIHEKLTVKCIFDEKKFKSEYVRPGMSNFYFH